MEIPSGRYVKLEKGKVKKKSWVKPIFIPKHVFELMEIYCQSEDARIQHLTSVHKLALTIILRFLRERMPTLLQPKDGLRASPRDAFYPPLDHAETPREFADHSGR